MKNQKLLYVLISIYLLFLYKTNDEVNFYKQSKIFKQSFDSISNDQKQCILLRKYFESIPDDEIYKKDDSFFKNIFGKQEYNLKSFQSIFLVILEEVSKFHKPNQSDLNIEKLNSLVDKLKAKNIPELATLIAPLARKNFNTAFTTENEKIYFLNNVLLTLKTKFLTYFFTNVNNYDSKITELKTQNKVLFDKKTKEIQDAYKILKDLIKKTKAKQDAIDIQINTLKTKPNSQKIIYDYKLVEEYLKKLDKPPCYKNYNPEDKFFENIINEAKTKFELTFEEPILEEVNKINVLLQNITQTREDIKGEKLIVRYYEFVKGLNFETSKKKKADDVEYKEFKEESALFITKNTEYNNFVKSYTTMEKNLIASIKNKINDITLKALKTTNSTAIEFIPKYLKFLTEVKKDKLLIMKQKKFINDKLIELNEINMKKNILNAKINSDIHIPNDLYLDFQIEISDARKKSNYLDYFSDEELNISIATFERTIQGLKDQIKVATEELTYNEQKIQEDTTKYKAETDEKKKKSLKNLISTYKKNIILTKKNLEDFNTLIGEYTGTSLVDRKIALKINKLEKGLEILELINEINEILDLKMANLLGRMQNMENNKKCFSLPHLSFYIFKMIKTNMLFYERTFLIEFLSKMDFEKQKKFILYNYMVSENRKYGIMELEKLNADPNYKSELVDNFSTNFSLFVVILRDLTSFSRNLEQKNESFKPSKLIKKIFSLIKLPSKLYLKHEQKDIIFKMVFPLIRKIIFTMLPFLNLIPFVEVMITVLQYKLYFSFRKLLVKLFFKGIDNTNTTLNNREQLNSINLDKNHTEIDLYNLDYKTIFDNENFFKDINIEESQPEINTDKVAQIEAQYKKISEGNNFDFQIFDAADNFTFNSDLIIDIEKLENQQYLQEHNLPQITLDMLI